MNQLRAFREALDIKQAAVAEKLGVSRQAVHDLETRPFATISAETCRRYRDAVKGLVAGRTTTEETARLAAPMVHAAAEWLLQAARVLEGAGAE